MFSIGDAVIHPAQGVCRITEITEKDFGGKKDKYYVLKSVYDGNSTVYIPVELVRERGSIRPALDKAQVDGIIDALEHSEPLAIENDNQRRLLFKDILASGNIADIGQMLKTVYLLKTSVRKPGRKMKVSDERIIRETEQSLYREFAFSLGITPEEIPQYISEKINNEC